MQPVMQRGLAFFLLFLAGFFPQSLWAQASVNENLETVILYVDGAQGSDTNPGTQASPFQTISGAVVAAQTNNYHGAGTKILINPGIYREDIRMMGSKYYTAMPITLEGIGSGVIVSGAVQYKNWLTNAGNSAIYSSPWMNEWGECPFQTGGPMAADIVRRREMIFVDGVPLTQVLKFGQVREGTFFVDESGGQIYIRPVAGTDIGAADVEVATLPELLHLVGVSNIVVRGLTFQYASSCRDNTAVFVAGSGKNILFDNDSFLWNNAVGLHVFTPITNFTVQNSAANHNGQSGMMSVSTKYGLWNSITTSFNNWRGAQGSYYTWNSAGIHFFSDHNHAVSGLVTAYNQTHGVHWDTDNANITVDNMTAVQNIAIGALVEKSQGPVAISNSHFCGNNLGIKINYMHQSGLALRNSELVTVTGTGFYNNQVSQIMVIGQKGGIQISNWETGQTYNLKSQNFSQTGNTIEAAGSQNTLTDGYLNGADWTVFQTTLNSNNNIWWNGSSETVFEVPVSAMQSLSGWQSVTAQDGLSTWSKPPDQTGACQAVAGQDYWLLADDASHTLDPTGNAVFGLSLIPFGGLTGTAAVSYDGTMEVSGLTSGLSTKSLPLTGSATLTVHGTVATLPGTYPITVYATSGGLTRTVTSYLIVPATSVRLSALSLKFSAQKVRTPSPPQSFSITNFGKTPLSLASMVFTGAKDYTQTNNCGSLLAAGATCIVNVTFVPKAATARNGVLTITDADLTSPQIVSLIGTGN